MASAKAAQPPRWSSSAAGSRACLARSSSPTAATPRRSTKRRRGPAGACSPTPRGYWADGQISEWGGELIDTGHKTIRKLAQRFDLSLDDLLAAQPAGSEETYYVFGAHYPKAQADLDFAAVYAAASADLTAAGYPTRYDAFTNAGALLDAMSAYDWIETRVPGGHASPLGAVLDIAYAIEYGAETTDQSALNLLYLLAYQPKPLGVFVLRRVRRTFPHPRRKPTAPGGDGPAPRQRRLRREARLGSCRRPQAATTSFSRAGRARRGSPPTT
jgi:monoamine oxidase